MRRNPCASLLGRREPQSGDLSLPIDPHEKVDLRAVRKCYEVDCIANVTLRPGTLLLERYGRAEISNGALDNRHLIVGEKRVHVRRERRAIDLAALHLGE